MCRTLEGSTSNSKCWVWELRAGAVLVLQDHSAYSMLTSFPQTLLPVSHTHFLLFPVYFYQAWPFCYVVRPIHPNLLSVLNQTYSTPCAHGNHTVTPTAHKTKPQPVFSQNLWQLPPKATPSSLYCQAQAITLHGRALRYCFSADLQSFKFYILISPPRL